MACVNNDGHIAECRDAEVRNLRDIWGRVWKQSGLKTSLFLMLFIWVDNALHTFKSTPPWLGRSSKKKTFLMFVCPLFDQNNKKKHKKMVWCHIQCNRIFILHWNVYRKQLRIEFLNEVDKYFDEKNAYRAKKKTTPNCWRIKHAVFPVSYKYVQKKVPPCLHIGLIRALKKAAQFLLPQIVIAILSEALSLFLFFW